MFIVFEWVDGSWKDTQLNKSVQYIREKHKNTQIWITKEPTANTSAGREILQKLKNWGFASSSEALNLYAQDRAEQSDIRREILKHSIILSSRFDYSTYAYQWVSGCSFEDIYAAHDYKNILLPDITFYFDVSKENIKKRLSQRGWEKEYFEEIDFLLQVSYKYKEIIEKFKGERNIIIIDANKSIDEVFEGVKKYLDIYLI